MFNDSMNKKYSLNAEMHLVPDASLSTYSITRFVATLF